MLDEVTMWSLDTAKTRFDNSTTNFSGAIGMTTATLAWTAVTTNKDGSPVTPPITYNLYQGTTIANLAKVQSGLTSPAATVTTGLTPGSTQEFAVTAVENGVESAMSSVTSAVIPFPTPSAPTGLTVTLS
jgi:hypothetical protein